MGFSWVLAAAGATAGSAVRYTDSVADSPHLQHWRESRGNGYALTQLYQSYHNEVLYAMAGNEDMYALLVAHDRLRNDGQPAEAYAGLLRAAALGSSAALIRAGEALYSDGHLWQQGVLDADTLRRVYGLPVELDPRLLTVSAAAHYVAAALMGDVDRADIQMEQMLMAYPADFIEQHWPVIEEQAEVLLQEIARYRQQVLALPAFDKGYPDAYARFYGLPLGQVSGEYLLDRWR